MRTKYIMQCPPGGGGEAVIEGTYYWPDEGGRIETNNPSHKDVLLRHGYTVALAEAIAAPPTNLGIIDYEEMGRGDLVQALAVRGVTFDGQGGRAALEDAAQAWNDARRGRDNQNAARHAKPVTEPDEDGRPTIKMTPEEAEAFQQWRASTQRPAAGQPDPTPPPPIDTGAPVPAAADVQPTTQHVGNAGTTVEQGKTRPAIKFISAAEIDAMTLAELKAYLAAEGVSFNQATPKPTLQRIARQAAGIQEAA